MTGLVGLHVAPCCMHVAKALTLITCMLRKSQGMHVTCTVFRECTTRQMLKASRGEPEKYKLRYIGVKAACV